jgi:hypothetical protein
LAQATPAFFERAVQISSPGNFLNVGPDFGNIRPTTWGGALLASPSPLFFGEPANNDWADHSSAIQR